MRDEVEVEVEVDKGRVRFASRLFRTRGALAAWLGNQMLLPCRAWAIRRGEAELA